LFYYDEISDLFRIWILVTFGIVEFAAMIISEMIIYFAERYLSKKKYNRMILLKLFFYQPEIKIA